MRTFQVEKRYSGGGKSWDYFDTKENDEEKIKQIAIKVVEQSYQKTCDFPVIRFSRPEKPCHTIYSKEYGVENGMKLKAKWR